MTGQERSSTDISSTGKTTTGDGQAPQATLTVNSQLNVGWQRTGSHHDRGPDGLDGLPTVQRAFADEDAAQGGTSKVAQIMKTAEHRGQTDERS